jgi:putative transcriptional regulator
MPMLFVSRVAPLPSRRNRLHVLRAERRLTQASLAEALGVSRQTVNAIETGKYDPSLSLAFRIATLFGRPIEQIFDPDATVDERASNLLAAPARAIE